MVAAGFACARGAGIDRLDEALLQSPAMARLPAATYRRRRVVGAAVAVGLLAAVVGGLREGPSSFEDLPRTPAELRARVLEAEPVELTISVSGDLLIHTPLWLRAQALAGGAGYDFAPLFNEIRPYVGAADLAICHVETPMTEAPPASYPIFNTPTALAQGIADSGWDACDTASNHSLDQGQAGIEATGRALDRAGIAHTGSFASERARGRPLVLDAGAARIGFLAYTSDTNGIPLPEPWSVNVIDAEQILGDARSAREAGADAVVVNLHWGAEAVAEYQPEPSAEQRALVERLLASPLITVVVGQGPHAVQPIERVGGKYVVFSEGNLVSNQSPAAGLPASSQDGLIALLDLVIDGRGARVEEVRYVPIWVRQPDYEVLPVGPALERGEADAAALSASYERTVGVAGRGPGIAPLPARLPDG